MAPVDRAQPDIKIFVAKGLSRAGHVVMLVTTARDSDEVPGAFQCLVYPVLDDRMDITRPVLLQIGTLWWMASKMRPYCGCYWAKRADWPMPLAFSRAPPTCRGPRPPGSGGGSINLFVADDIFHVTRLIEASAHTELMVGPSAFHGSDIIGAATGPAKRS